MKFDQRKNQAYGGRGRGASREQEPLSQGKGKPSGEHKKWPQLIITSLNLVGGPSMCTSATVDVFSIFSFNETLGSKPRFKLVISRQLNTISPIED